MHVMAVLMPILHLVYLNVLVCLNVTHVAHAQMLLVYLNVKCTHLVYLNVQVQINLDVTV